jgi:hypothetical protein
MATFIAISQVETALRNFSFALFPIAVRAVADNRGSLLVHQMNA